MTGGGEWMFRSMVSPLRLSEPVFTEDTSSAAYGHTGAFRAWKVSGRFDDWGKYPAHLPHEGDCHPLDFRLRAAPPLGFADERTGNIFEIHVHYAPKQPAKYTPEVSRRRWASYRSR